MAKKISAFADLGGDFDDDMVAKVAGMRARLRDLDIRLTAAKEEMVDGDPDAIATSVVEEMTHMGEQIAVATPMTMRRILSVFVEKMECDPSTREVWLTLRLPSWAANSVSSMGKVCSGCSTLQSRAPEANNLLLAQVYMRCLLLNRNSKGTRRLEKYAYSITDGILTFEGERCPMPPATPALAAAVFSDVNAVVVDSPYFDRMKPLTVPIVSMGLPMKINASEVLDPPLPLPWSFWTPISIAA